MRTLPLTSTPDFNELKALGIYVFLLGISGFALAYWVYEDCINIEKFRKFQKLMSARRHVKPAPRESTDETELKQIVLLECPECGKEISRNFNLCPYCGTRLK